jgi:hypothetical protein
MLHPRSLRPRHLLPPLLVPYLIAAAAAAPVRPRLAAALVAPYAGALAVATVSAGRRVDDVAARALLPAAFLAMHVGWGVGVWSRAFDLLRRRTAR